MDKIFNFIMIDDEDFILDNLANSFDWNKMGFNLLATFKNPLKALEFLEDGQVEMVISDIKMPNMSGLDLAKLIKEKYPDIFIVMLSGHRDFEYARAAISLGVFSYLLKPVKHSDITDVFSELWVKLSEKKKEEEDFASFENVPLPMQKAISDLIEKKSTDFSELKSILKNNNIDIEDIERVPAALVEIELTDLENYLKTVWTHSKDQLFSAIKNIATDSEIVLIPTKYLLFDRTEFLAISKTDDCEIFLNSLRRFQSGFNMNCFELLNLASIVIINPIAKNLSALLLQSETEDRIKYEASMLFKYILSGDSLKSDARLSEILAENENSADYMCIFAYQIYLKLIEKISFDDLKSFRIYPENLKIPVELDVYNFPKNIDVMISSLNNTIKYSAMYFSGNLQENQDIISKVKHYIDQHYMEKITLSTVANYVFFSESHFSRYFKKETGLNFIDYLSFIRIKNAQELLLKTPLNVNEICEMVGYPTTRHFYKKFKEQTGFTAQEYRKRFLELE